MATQTTAPATAPTTRSGSGNRRDGLTAFIFIAPNMLLFSVFVLAPIVGGLLLSFTTWDLSGSPKWVGLQNYHDLLHDPMVGMAVKTTLYFTAFGVIPTIIISFSLAMLINVQFRGISIIRSLYLIPAAVSFAASAVLWQWIFRPGLGLLDFVLGKFGLAGPTWLADTSSALPSLDIVTVWLTLPTATLLYLAALQRIPDSVIEASILDGAGVFRRVRYVVWPAVSNMTRLVAIVTLLAFTNSSFDLVNILTQGGPIYSTQTLIYYIYNEAFANGLFGYAAALSVLQLLIIAAILAGIGVLSKLTRR